MLSWFGLLLNGNDVKVDFRLCEAKTKVPIIAIWSFILILIVAAGLQKSCQEQVVMQLLIT